MQQPSVADYFKVKKRTRDEALNFKKSKSSSSKLVAISSESGKKSPNRISAVSDASSPDEPSPTKYFSPCRQKDIFSSPVKLNEIRSPVKKSPSLVAKSAVKRLFFSDSGSDSESFPGLKASKLPAYERYNHLAEKTVDGQLESAPVAGPTTLTPIVAETSSTVIPTLQLPLKYSVLLELFRAVETVSSFFYNRKETITFMKLKPAVQELMRKISLKEKHLGQMIQVFPDCYKLFQEKRKAGSHEASYQLCLAFNFTATPNTSEAVTSPFMIERRRIFHKNLISICQGHHKNFLLTVDPPIVIPHGKKVTRWHPKFRLDDVPDIPVAHVPRPPESNKMSNPTAMDVISRAQDILQCANPRMKKALEELRKKTEVSQVDRAVPAKKEQSADPVLTSNDPHPKLSASTAGLQISEPPVDRLAATKIAIAKAQEVLLKKARNLDPKKAKAIQDMLAKSGKPAIVNIEANNTKNTADLPNPVPTSSATSSRGVQAEKIANKTRNNLGALKGISLGLLEKIRAREQENSIRAMTLTPEETKRRAMLNRLPEFVKILRNAMVAEKKSAMSLRLIVDRVCHSHRGSLSEIEGESHIRLLAELVPEWITLLKCTQGEYMKIDKTLDINDLLERLNEIIRRTK